MSANPFDELRPDDAGELSIIVQGGLSRGTLCETALHCRHWRELFPTAQIILSLSGCDILTGIGNDGLLSDIRLVEPLRHDTVLDAALQMILSNCDKIALSHSQIALPPIKSDTARPNHINLQIAAARNGLRHATGRYILRARSELIFQDRSFLAQFAAGAPLPRGDAAALSRRVMISWLYTLNPYTIERLPLHFSDWFHFGLAQDVRALWEVPPVALADAVHYRAHPHAYGSSHAERLFHIRLADEQHLLFHAMRAFFDDMVLDHHNDCTDVRRAMDILADNFVVCDLAEARCIFGKYATEFGRHEKGLHCITAADWRAMVAFRNIDYRITLSHKIGEWHDKLGFERRQGFPRTYDASRLDAREGACLNGEIIANGITGVLLSGPQVALPVGEYIATVTTTHLEGPGAVVLKATLNAERTVLAERRIPLVRGQAADLCIDFAIAVPDAADFRLVCELEDVKAIAVRTVTIAERGIPRRAVIFPAHFTMPVMEKSLASGAPGGGIFRLRLPTLQPGSYVAALNPASPAPSGTVSLRVDMPDGGLIAAREIALAPTARTDLSIAFNIIGRATEVELSCTFEGLSGLSVASVILALGADGDCPEACYYEAGRLHAEHGRFDGGRLVSTNPNGRLSYGPFITLPPGHYTATIDVAHSQGGGQLTAAVLTDIGAARLAECQYDLSAREPPILPFEVPEQGAWKLEVACTLQDVPAFALAGILIRKHDTPQPRSAGAVAQPPRRSWRDRLGLLRK